MLTPLCELAVKYRTDKTPALTSHEWRTHGYTPYYHQLLSHRNVKRVLEIGIAGGASLRMWRDYFPQAQVYGWDIDEKTFFIEERIHCSHVDQGNCVSLVEAALRLGGTFDLIVDDGSHESAHQALTANVLVPFLSAGGVYVIEDVCHPEEVTPRLKHPHEVRDFNLGLLSDDRLVVIRAR